MQEKIITRHWRILLWEVRKQWMKETFTLKRDITSNFNDLVTKHFSETTDIKDFRWKNYRVTVEKLPDDLFNWPRVDNIAYL